MPRCLRPPRSSAEREENRRVGNASEEAGNEEGTEQELEWPRPPWVVDGSEWDGRRSDPRSSHVPMGPSLNPDVHIYEPIGQGGANPGDQQVTLLTFGADVHHPQPPLSRNSTDDEPIYETYVPRQFPPPPPPPAEAVEDARMEGDSESHNFPPPPPPLLEEGLGEENGEILREAKNEPTSESEGSGWDTANASMDMGVVKVEGPEKRETTPEGPTAAGIALGDLGPSGVVVADDDRRQTPASQPGPDRKSVV